MLLFAPRRSRPFPPAIRACTGIPFFFIVTVGCWPHATVAREEVARLTSQSVTGGSGFGLAVAICGNHIVVGAPYDTASATGAAVVFVRNGSSWSEQVTLVGSAVGFRDTFGFSVALEGDLLVVGAPHDDPAGPGFGFATVFRNSGKAWVEEAVLFASGSELADSFGWSVEIDAGRIVVGAPGENFETGAAYVFALDGTTWLEEARLAAVDGASGDAFGRSVSVLGDRIVVGAIRNIDANATSGSVYVFRREGKSWLDEQKLSASDAPELIAFGLAVSMDGTSILVGAPNDDELGINAGSAYVFRKDASEWIQQAKLTASDTVTLDAFGGAAALRRNIAVIGRSGRNDEEDRAGAAYLFKRHQDQWFEVDKLVASEANPSIGLGVAISIDQDTCAVGAGGAVYLFDLKAGIPATSRSGIIILLLTLLMAGSVLIKRHRKSHRRA